MLPAIVSRLDQRSSLDTLTKARLLDIAERLGVEVASSHPKAEVVDVLAASKRASFEQILLTLSRDELKAICRSHGADDKGREKQVLVDRILGREAASPVGAGAKAGRSASQLDENRRYRVPGAEHGTSTAKEVSLGYDVMLRRSAVEPVEAPKGRGRRRRAAGETTGRAERKGRTGDDAIWAASTKIRLRRFAVEAAGAYRGRDAEIQFAEDLIRCFGWGPDEALPAEIPAVVSVVERGLRTERRLCTVLRERRAVVEIVDQERSTSEAWTELLPILLQLEPVPQYVVLSNQRDFALYDLARSRTAARLERSLDELSKYSEAFPFLARDWSPGATPQIINVERVSTEVAELVARVHRSFAAQHPDRQGDVIRFTLQCIIAMFAEDVGLLPTEHFTGLLYQAAAHGDAEARLGELFRQMSDPGEGSRVIRYFNGGLFSTPVVLPVGKDQLTFLTKASEANWKYVEPHIFGSVFQGIMGEAERHAQGAHYTSKEDIMRVVGPTIVEPWRRRISAASSLSELRALRVELTRFRVLDPACGSGNFLYIAFRELYRLETELLSRMREFPSVDNNPDVRGAWGSGISAANFYGIDINPFAVELARATLNIAKKIAFEERRQHVADKFGQLELELDPSLPLDNLERNIVCKDALFMEWPEVEAIVGNPPILGDRKIRAELGEAYLGRLRAFPGVDRVVDLSCYWFRKAHDRLAIGGRAGLVGTSGLRIGKAREAALDYVVNNGGTITNAVSSLLWSGEAALNVCMVNWVKGVSEGPHQLIVEGRTFAQARIPTHLQLHTDVSRAQPLEANDHGTAMGVIFGSDAFTSEGNRGSMFDSLRGGNVLRPIATGTALLTGLVAWDPVHCIYLGHCKTEADASKYAGAAFRTVRALLHGSVGAKADVYAGWLERWWQPLRPQIDFFHGVDRMHRYIVCSNPQARPIFAFLSTKFIPTNTLQVFAFDDDYSFGIIQSSLHWEWLKAKGGKVRADIRYTSDVWRTFPWPQQPAEPAITEVAAAARFLRETRRTLMDANGWSLRALHQAAEVPGPHPLKDAQARLDAAVATAYDLPPGQEPLEFLLELNLVLAEDEAAGHAIVGPGLPPGYDPKDPRWHSTDCIEPPRLDTRTKDHDG